MPRTLIDAVHTHAQLAVSPFSYGLRSYVINEFTSPQWDQPDPSAPGTLGDNVLLFRGFPTKVRLLPCSCAVQR